MGFFGSGRGGVWRGVCCAGLVWVVLGSVSALETKAETRAKSQAKPKHSVALTPWQQAVRARAGFEAQLAGTHTRAQYAQMLDQFRAIYHNDPGDAHAADAVYAVAELLAEQGRELSETASLRNAIGQYEFLRAQYPASPLREEALLDEGRIEDQDLRDARAAREKYQALLAEAPRSPAAGEARVALAGMGRGSKSVTPAQRDEAAMNRAPTVPEPPKSSPPQPPAQGLALTEANARAVERAAARARAAEADGAVVGDTQAPSASQPRGVKTRVANSDGQVVGDSLSQAVAPAAAPPAVAPAEVRRAAVARPARTEPLAQVTGIRHWSTATYTRVAIDLGDEVTFEAARVPNPDRIYFDLHGAKLGAELVGKSFSVTDDGFLKRIRAAQAGPDVTRVVLDVNDVTDYSAFLLPNPYRLIIDIHGAKDSGPAPIVRVLPAETIAETTAETPVAPADPVRASAAANSSGLPAMAPTNGGDAVRPAQLPLTASASEGGRTLSDPKVSSPRRAPPATAATAKPVPNTVTVRAPATANEVAAVSDAPGRVEATRAPTSKPIAASVPAAKEVYLGSNPTTTRRKRAKPADTTVAVAAAAPAKAAEKTADGETSMIRALGLKINRIVIDAGHGGHDSGTLGAEGIEEKDVVLDVALRLGKLLHERLGAEIIYTRSDDTFIPLETRTAIANKAQADLFLSIHANSSPDSSARGVETYYLNFTSDPAALDVAARENAVGEQSIHQLSDLVKKITLKDKIEESREFASDVQASLYGGLERGNDGLKNRGVKKAPFVVLIGANMPSILAEISFVTNPTDSARLREPEYRERVAESLYAGVAKYESGLAGAKPTTPVQRAATY